MVKLFLNWCSQHYYIDEAQYSIIEWQIHVFLETLFKIFIILCLAFLSNKVFETISILLAFCGLRFFIGGFHFKKNLFCTMFAFLMWIISLYISAAYFISLTTKTLLFLITLIIIFIFGPANGTLYVIEDKNQISHLKMKGILFVFILFIISLFPIYQSNGGLFAIPLLIESLTIINFKKEKGNTRYDEKKGISNASR